MYKIITYLLQESNIWTKQSTKYYENNNIFIRQQKYYKEKYTKPITISTDPYWHWVNNVLNQNMTTRFSGAYRVVSEEMVNGSWVVLEDWTKP